MNYYFVTGSSKGLGKSIVDLLLKDKNNVVYGLARTCSVQHERYIHTSVDMRELKEVIGYEFPLLENMEKLVLINSAGMVGDIKHVGAIDNQKIIDSYNLNLIAPVILANNFIAKYSNLDSNKTVLNISSGAGRSPIDGWSTYCSTKAGMDMFSQVLDVESQIDQSNVKVLSLAPGIIDTAMQREIRASDECDFSNINRFVDYKKNNDLASPEETAINVLRFVNEENLSENVLCSVRDLTK